MKRVMLIISVFVICVTLFPVNAVYAVTDNTNTRARYSVSGTSSEVTYTATAVQLYTELTTNTGNASSSSGIIDGYFNVQYVITIYNASSSYKTVSGLTLSSSFGSTTAINPNIQYIDNQSDDAFIAIKGTTATTDKLTIVPGADHSYNNAVLVAPKETITAIAEVQFKSLREYGGTQSAEPLISGISWDSGITVATVDINADSVDEPAHSSALQLLTDLSTPSNGVTGIARVNYGRSYILSDTVDPDTLYHSYTRVMPIQVYFRVNNNSGANRISSTILQMQDIILTYYANYSWEVVFSESDLWMTPRLYSNSRKLWLEMYYKDTINGNVIPPGVHTGIVIFNLYYDETVPEIPESFVFNLGTFSAVVTDNDNLNDDAADLKQQIDDIHTQEQEYYNNNVTAIQNTGLSNYRFNENQILSFSLIRSQFTEVWNALGDWNLIYIFTLLFSLTVYIIRHEPTTKVKQYRESVKNERYERTQYYGRMNAQARADASAGKKSNEFVNRVRKRNG